jgi:diguanylate cyclase (GGDEF)-like protein
MSAAAVPEVDARDAALAHPRKLTWVGTTALAMGGSNQSLFLIAALFIGQGSIPGQGSAAVILLIVGLLLSWAAAPGWTELVLMYPKRVGGISATCAEAFKPYGAVLANLTGVCYWWGWVPTCGLTAILSASAIHHWYLPMIPINLMAVGLVLFFTAVTLCGIKWVSRLAIPIASISALMAMISGLAPIFEGSVDWHQATSFDLTVPFKGVFGQLTSLMAGLYLVGFAAPAFEAAACHVGETIDPNKNVPRAMLASGLLAGLYFLVLPLVWLGTLGAGPLGEDLAMVLGPTFAPVFASGAKAAAIWFMMFSMFSGTLQPLAGAARCLSQLSEDGLLPRILAKRSRTDAPWAATLLTAGMAILFLLIGDPIWLIAAANFTYLIGIALPSVAVWLLRRDAPELHRPYRAPRGTIMLGVMAAATWGISALLGFEQFGLPTVVVGLGFAYSGSVLYAWRRYSDRRDAGLPAMPNSLQIKLTGAMLLVLALDGTGYILAVSNIPPEHRALLAGLADIFVAVAMLSITVALILPGMVAHSVMQVSAAAKHLMEGTVADFSRAMTALGKGNLDGAYATADATPIPIRTHDEVGEMAAVFNSLQVEICRAAVGLDGAREGLRNARSDLTYLATHDVLTGLPNRILLKDRLDQALVHAYRAVRSVALLFLDLDGFKFINDSYGHPLGDKLLRSVALRLTSVVRAGDTVARLGGDEFVILLVDIRSEQEAAVVAQSILNALKDPFEFENLNLHVSGSIGISGYTDSGDTSDLLLKRADIAMYCAKAGGRSRYAIYTADMSAQAESRVNLESALRRALDHDELEVHYQPQVEVSTGKIIGVEALIRWNDPILGVVSPQSLIAIAEETGLIIAVGEWVLRTACAQLANWHANGHPGLTVAVNIAARQIHQRDFLKIVEQVLADTRLEGKYLELELTESTLINESDAVITTLQGLKALGVTLSLDDFGTGYSSLSYLKRFPIDVIKIDQSFTLDLATSADAASIIKAILAMAQSLKIRTIAEGVETTEQLEFLRANGCNVIQGYYFSRAIPAQDASAFMSSRTAGLSSTERRLH